MATNCFTDVVCSAEFQDLSEASGMQMKALTKRCYMPPFVCRSGCDQKFYGLEQYFMHCADEHSICDMCTQCGVVMSATDTAEKDEAMKRMKLIEFGLTQQHANCSSQTSAALTCPFCGVEVSQHASGPDPLPGLLTHYRAVHSTLLSSQLCPHCAAALPSPRCRLLHERLVHGRDEEKLELEKIEQLSDVVKTALDVEKERVNKQCSAMDQQQRQKKVLSLLNDTGCSSPSMLDLQLADDQPLFSCSLNPQFSCSEEYFTLEEYFLHCVSIHNSPFFCLLCGFVQTVQQNSLQHFGLQRHENCPVNDCPFCKKSGLEGPEIYRHITTDHYRHVLDHQCALCFCILPTTRALRVHLYFAHALEDAASDESERPSAAEVLGLAVKERPSTPGIDADDAMTERLHISLMEREIKQILEQELHMRMFEFKNFASKSHEDLVTELVTFLNCQIGALKKQPLVPEDITFMQVQQKIIKGDVTTCSLIVRFNSQTSAAVMILNGAGQLSEYNRLQRVAGRQPLSIQRSTTPMPASDCQLQTGYLLKLRSILQSRGVSKNKGIELRWEASSTSQPYLLLHDNNEHFPATRVPKEYLRLTRLKRFEFLMPDTDFIAGSEPMGETVVYNWNECFSEVKIQEVEQWKGRLLKFTGLSTTEDASELASAVQKFLDDELFSGQDVKPPLVDIIGLAIPLTSTSVGVRVKQTDAVQRILAAPIADVNAKRTKTGAKKVTIEEVPTHHEFSAYECQTLARIRARLLVQARPIVRAIHIVWNENDARPQLVVTSRSGQEHVIDSDSETVKLGAKEAEIDLRSTKSPVAPQEVTQQPQKRVVTITIDDALKKSPAAKKVKMDDTGIVAQLRAKEDAHCLSCHFLIRGIDKHEPPNDTGLRTLLATLFNDVIIKNTQRRNIPLTFTDFVFACRVGEQGEILARVRDPVVFRHLKLNMKFFKPFNDSRRMNARRMISCVFESERRLGNYETDYLWNEFAAPLKESNPNMSLELRWSAHLLQPELCVTDGSERTTFDVYCVPLKYSVGGKRFEPFTLEQLDEFLKPISTLRLRMPDLSFLFKNSLVSTGRGEFNPLQHFDGSMSALDQALSQHSRQQVHQHYQKNNMPVPQSNRFDYS